MGRLKNEKLFPYIGRHEKVLRHITLIKFWLDMGVVLEEVHYLVEVEQEDWMRDYILEMGRKRAASTDEVTKHILKLSINSLYGKCLQDELKQRNLRPYTSPSKFAKAACIVGKDFHIQIMDEDVSWD